MMHREWLAIGSTILLFANVALAQAAQPPPMVSGGVGSESRDEMAAVANDYSLHVVLATRSGSFLANVQVEIADEAGNLVAQTVSDGPLLYVDLPPGRYTVEATRDDGPRGSIGAKVPASGPPVEVVLRIGETDPK